MPVRHATLNSFWIAAQELDRGPIMNGRVWNITEATPGDMAQDCAEAGIDATQEQHSILLFKEQTVGSGGSVMLQVQYKGVVDIAQQYFLFQ